MKKTLMCGLLCVLVLAAATNAAITIDGVITDGEWNDYIATETPDDNGGGEPYCEMTRWGAKVEGDYLYWFCELDSSQPFTSFQGMAGTKEKKIFTGLWIDVDADGGGQPGDYGTWLTDGGSMNCADHEKKEWGTEL
ncbi:MAG: hypothetical protein JXM70_23520, partial [Pirellulales bacterium]|nr:hypothetical protein [Pirellulales bacterium]